MCMEPFKAEFSDIAFGGQCNIGHICTKLQCDKGLSDKVALRYIDSKMNHRDYTFADLDAESSRFANALDGLGISSNDIVFTYLPKVPEQFFSFLGAMKAQIICGTLFSNFGEEALVDRLGDADAKIVVTKASLLKKIQRVWDQLPNLQYVLVVDIPEDLSDNILSYGLLTDNASPDFVAEQTAPNAPSVLHYTSGSTGKPKGVLHCHGSVLQQESTSREILGLGPDDVFWCTADQGWVTGTSYGVIGPWALGVTQVHLAGAYDAEKWLNLLEAEKISVWYTSPTALRMLMRESDSLYRGRQLDSLKAIFSVGEPLNPEVIAWGRRVFTRDIFDTWFQTETGAIMISNRPGLKVRPGSMGKPIPGIEAVVLSDEGKQQTVGNRGHLCIKAGWPSMFKNYLNSETTYLSKFRGNYYLTGDTAYVDKDGYFWFCGRSDDVINTSGHLISPFEIESALLEVPEVVESGVVGAPDDLLFEKIVAFVCLRDGVEPTKQMELKLKIYVNNKASSIAVPQEIIFVKEVPKNKSGKIMRRVLKARYLGDDIGDTSTIEG